MPLHPHQTKTLIFDLDETLAHCLEPEENEDLETADHLIQIELKNPDTAQSELIQAGINLRPFVRECLA